MTTSRQKRAARKIEELFEPSPHQLLTFLPVDYSVVEKRILAHEFIGRIASFGAVYGERRPDAAALYADSKYFQANGDLRRWSRR